MTLPIPLKTSRRSARTAGALVAGAVLVTSGAAAYAQSAGATSSDTLIGSALNALGTAVATLQAQVAALQANDHVERATLTPSGALAAQGIRWVSRVDHPGPGTYVLTMTPGAFSAPPTCVASAIASDPIVPGAVANPALASPAVVCTAATLAGLVCQARVDKAAAVDTALSVICAGQ